MLMKVFGNGQNGENKNQEYRKINGSFWNKKRKQFPHSWPIWFLFFTSSTLIIIPLMFLNRTGIIADSGLYMLQGVDIKTIDLLFKMP